MKNWKVELAKVGKTIAEVKIQRGSFQGDALSLLQFEITTMPLNYVLRKCTESNKFIKSQEKINHLLYTDDLKVFAKKQLDTLIQII